jgi:hypothetical protein
MGFLEFIGTWSLIVGIAWAIGGFLTWRDGDGPRRNDNYWGPNDGR